MVERISSRRAFAALLSVAAVACAAAAVSGWTQVGPTGFQLPNSNPIPIWTGPKTTRVATTVTVSGTTGLVRFAGYDVPWNPANPTNPAPVLFGQVPKGRSATFEGNFETITLTNLSTGVTVGTYAQSTDGGPPANRLVGAGTVALQGSGAFTFYGSAGPALCRVATVQAGSGSVVLAPSNLTVDAGDWGFASATTSTFAFTPSSAAGAPVYKVVDYVHLSGHVEQGTCTCQSADDRDAVSVDGTKLVRVTLTNTSATGAVTLSTVVGGAASTVTVPSGQSQVVDGVVSSFEWTYAAPGQTVLVKLE